MSKIVLIWGQDEKGGIGKNNCLPWDIKEDLEHFKETTINNVVVMGKNTFKSIGKLLPNRTNVVLSKSLSDVPQGVHLCTSIHQVLKSYPDKDLYIIGGKCVYEQFFPLASQLIISYIKGTYDCDTYLSFDLSKFKLTRVQSYDSFNVKYYSLQDSNNSSNPVKPDNFLLSLDQFDGPLDLLWTLIKNKKYDLYNLDICSLTQQYLSYIDKLGVFINLDSAGDYLELASELVNLKSLSLLAQSDGDNSSSMSDYEKHRDEFLKRILEYTKLRRVISFLSKRQKKRIRMFIKQPDLDPDLFPKGQYDNRSRVSDTIPVSKLYYGYMQALDRYNIDQLKKQKLNIPKISIEHIIDDFWTYLKSLETDTICFQDYLQSLNLSTLGLKYVMSLFLAILNLIKAQKLIVHINDHNQIYLTKSDVWSLNDNQ